MVYCAKCSFDNCSLGVDVARFRADYAPLKGSEVGSHTCMHAPVGCSGKTG
jgi:hypothetical protein